jgi:hypothetical protein
MLPDVVGSTITRDRAFMCADFLVSSWVLHYVVLDKWVFGPTINGKEGNACTRESATVSDWAREVTESAFEDDDRGKVERNGSYSVSPGFQPSPTTKSDLVLNFTVNSPELSLGEY